MAERHSITQKHTLGKPQGVFLCALLPGHERVDRRSSSSSQCVDRHSSQPAQLALGTARSRRGSRSATRDALVDTSVYLQPAELVNVALNVLTRLAPCLNLGVGELGHKDLLDTVGADNCRK